MYMHYRINFVVSSVKSSMEHFWSSQRMLFIVWFSYSFYSGTCSFVSGQQQQFSKTNGPGTGDSYPKTPPKLASLFTWTATGTHYSPSQAGSPICSNRDTYCGAPSDGSAFWFGGLCHCSGNDPTCKNGYCYDCNGANECKSDCPSCPTSICGHRFRITCLDPHGKGYCRSQGAAINMTVTNACPQYNPCNTCKSNNPCRANYNHIDLCDATFDAIAYRNRQPAEGIMIGVDNA